MAGGKGTRLASILKDIPKPMVSFAGKPLLEHQIDNLKKAGITEVILVIGHLGNVIKEHFGDGRGFGVCISYFEEKEPLGTAGALAYLTDILDEDFLLVFGDLYFNINIERFAEYHKKNEALITLYVHPNSHPSDSDIILTDKFGCVTGILPKSEPRVFYYKNQVNAGIYMVSLKALSYIRKGQKNDLEKQVILDAISSKKVFAYSCSEYVKDIGTPERLLKTENDYNKGICNARNLENKQKCIFLDRDGTINKYVGLLTKSEDMVLEEGVGEAIRQINESEYICIVVTNQPIIARGDCTFEELDKIHNKMYTLLGQKGAYIDDLYYCPHHPDSGYEGEVKEYKVKCNCRKPDIGLYKKAAKDHNIDLTGSWVIGDTTTDILSGKKANAGTIMVRTGVAGQDNKYDVNADYTTDNLLEAVEYILRRL